MFFFFCWFKCWVSEYLNIHYRKKEKNTNKSVEYEWRIKLFCLYLVLLNLKLALISTDKIWFYFLWVKIFSFKVKFFYDLVRGLNFPGSRAKVVSMCGTQLRPKYTVHNTILYINKYHHIFADNRLIQSSDIFS